jgi:hypothetical protein
MPLKNDKPYCVNHPDHAMVLAKDGEEEIFHLLVRATKNPSCDDRYELTNKATVVDLYACTICGYCEAYLIHSELVAIKALTGE